MIDDGLIERFGIEEVYGMHNWPGMPVGQFAIRAGADHGRGRPLPHRRSTARAATRRGRSRRIDPIVVAASMIVTALQSIVSRNVDPLAIGVLSVALVEAGEAYNVIPQTAKIKGTVRTLNGRQCAT